VEYDRADGHNSRQCNLSTAAGTGRIGQLAVGFRDLWSGKRLDSADSDGNCGRI
jgi:hypothetical protein